MKNYINKLSTPTLDSLTLPAKREQIESRVE
jgi:hypothetical protein